MRGAAGACDIDEEGPKQRIGEPFIIVEQLHVEEIARMLTIHGGMKLATKQILE
jgi:hypothetical protein